MTRHSALLALMMLFSGLMSAQSLFNYSCDFEDPNQNLLWTCTSASGINNRWHIGSALNNGGQNGMYVSADGGTTAGYQAQGSICFAYTDFTLPKDTFTLSFDWIGMGYLSGSTTEAIYAFWVPDRDDLGDSIRINTIASSSYGTNVLFTDYTLVFDRITGTDYLNGASTWRSQSVRFKSDGKHHRLVFAWRSSNEGPGNPGGGIDNINIVSDQACAAPTNINLQTQANETMTLSWEGDAGQYEAGFYSYETKQWEVYTTTDTFYTVVGVPEGYCDFYVRTICHDEESGIQYYSGKLAYSQFVYYPDKHCVDYLTLSDENCYINTEKPSSVLGNYGYVKQMVDEGSESKTSRHTIHYSKTETDPRTRGKLRTVPEGEIASVRLGNWNAGGESERIEFKYNVDEISSPILILRYAVVLESPGHDASKPKTATNLEDPRFKLEILNGTKSIGRCATADFTSSWVEEGWTRDTVKYLDNGSAKTMNVVWKDWTTIGINLSAYAGKTLTIRLSTYDCSFSAHCGYAYFTLGCASDQLDGFNCDGLPSTDFKAPEGFSYRWYLAEDTAKTTLGSEQVFSIDSLDSREYNVDVMFPEDSTCYFTLSASSKPHYPAALLDYKITSHDCHNYLTVTDQSAVFTIYKDKGDTVRSACDSVRWLIGNTLLRGGFKNMEIPFPDEGGVIHIHGEAYMNQCAGSNDIKVLLPNLHHQFTRLDTVIIKGNSVLFDGVERTETGTYTKQSINKYGCESNDTLNLIVHENIVASFLLADSVCADGTIWEPTFSILKGAEAATRYSVLWKNNTFDSQDSLVVTNNYTLHVELPQPIVPDRYEGTLILHDSLSWMDEKIVDWKQDFVLIVNYPDTVITQRWSDVLAIMNTQYNGGFDIIGFQWYKNNLPIEGATESYLYEPAGLDRTAEYKAQLTRAGDSLKLFTCPIVPESFNTGMNIPTLVNRGAQVPLRSKNAGIAAWITPMGISLQQQSYAPYGAVQAPSAPGIYLLLLTEDGKSTPHRIIVK